MKWVGLDKGYRSKRVSTMASSQNFTALLQQAEQLTADIEDGDALPRVRRNLQQVAEAGQRLLDRTSGVRREDVDVKA